MGIAPCPPSTPITKGIVTFDPAEFRAAYTSFATVSDPALNLSFTLAQLQLNNSCGSRVCNAVERETLLNLLVAHITALKDGENGNPPAGIVGHVDKAQEGSVSVSANVGVLAYGQAYYMQTQWGALYWTATAKYRQFKYVPAPAVCADYGSLGPGFPGPGGYFPTSGGGGCGC